jgi:hypothetical protein
MSTLAEDLLGRNAALMRDDQTNKRVHRMEDDAPRSTPKLNREAILGALREKQPLDRPYFREVLGINGADLEIALTHLRAKGLLYGIQGEGYRLGRRPLPAVAGTPVLQPSKEKDDMKPKDHFEQIEQFLKDNEEWHAPADIAKKLGHARAGTVLRLATLAKQKKIQAAGKRRGLRYAALGVAQPSPANLAATIPAKDERKATSATKRRAGAKAAGTAARERKMIAAASFLVDDAGRVTVVGTDGARVELTLPDTKRLATFIKAHAGK